MERPERNACWFWAGPELLREKAPEGQSLQEFQEERGQTDWSEGFDGVVVTFPRLGDENHTGFRPRFWDIAQFDTGFEEPA